MLKYLMLVMLLTTPAIAQQSTSRSFFDVNGRYQGQATTRGNHLHGSQRLLYRQRRQARRLLCEFAVRYG
jgi:hypothetical protein